MSVDLTALSDDELRTIARRRLRFIEFCHETARRWRNLAMPSSEKLREVQGVLMARGYSVATC